MSLFKCDCSHKIAKTYTYISDLRKEVREIRELYDKLITLLTDQDRIFNNNMQMLSQLTIRLDELKDSAELYKFLRYWSEKDKYE